jgi:MFS family permease
MNKLKTTILSLSLITVMAGAATAPALGAIASHFNEVSTLLIKMILTLPSFFIFFTLLFFNTISNILSTKKIALTGLLLYIAGGCGAGFVSNIYSLLIFRAVLGVGVGLIMPLSTGLISYYFDKSEQSKLMGYSSAMNNLGGVIAMSLAGLLVTINWRLSFAIYLMGLLVLILVFLFLPDAELKRTKNKLDNDMRKKISPCCIGIFITMLIFYTLPSNFAIVVMKENLIPSSLIGTFMSLQTVGAFIVGMNFSLIKQVFKQNTKYAAVLMLFIGYITLAMTSHIIFILIGLLSIGFGIGIMVPLLFSQIALRINKENGTSAMASMSSMLYLGQFVSPIVIQLSQSLMNISNIRFPYYIAALISIILFFYMGKIKTEELSSVAILRP